MSENNNQEEVKERDPLVIATLSCNHTQTMSLTEINYTISRDALGNKWVLCQKCSNGEKGACPDKRTVHRVVDERIYQSPETLKK